MIASFRYAESRLTQAACTIKIDSIADLAEKGYRVMSNRSSAMHLYDGTRIEAGSTSIGLPFYVVVCFHQSVPVAVIECADFAGLAGLVHLLTPLASLL